MIDPPWESNPNSQFYRFKTAVEEIAKKAELSAEKSRLSASAARAYLQASIACTTFALLFMLLSFLGWL